MYELQNLKVDHAFNTIKRTTLLDEITLLDKFIRPIHEIRRYLECIPQKQFYESAKDLSPYRCPLKLSQSETAYLQHIKSLQLAQ
ncbi:hypothetical protein AGMMS49975_29870 [Clostridia bacterium]|nr:hypothetical protein AGMMS49975_29870 [Clostridia bacterium]